MDFRMNRDIRYNRANDGSVDADYTWGRPVTTYVSTLQHMHLLLLKARLDPSGTAILYLKEFEIMKYR